MTSSKMARSGGAPSAADVRRTKAAFARLAEVMRALRPEADAMLARIDGMAAQVDARPLRDVIADEPRPLVVTTMTRFLDELTLAAAEVRRAEAAQLRAEGLSQQQIADALGVTRQRAASYLNGPAPHLPTKRPGRGPR